MQKASIVTSQECPDPETSSIHSLTDDDNNSNNRDDNNDENEWLNLRRNRRSNYFIRDRDSITEI